MINVLYKSCRENKNAHLCSITFSRKSCRLRECQKIRWSKRDHKRRHNMVHTRCMLDKRGYTRARAFTHPHFRSPTHAPMHARTPTQTNTRMEHFLLFDDKNNSRTRLIVTLYVHCLSCFVLR